MDILPFYDLHELHFVYIYIYIYIYYPKKIYGTKIYYFLRLFKVMKSIMNYKLCKLKNLYIIKFYFNYFVIYSFICIEKR